MAYSTDIKDYYRRAWGLGDRVPFKHGGTWADWKVNYEDQMSFEEYLQDDKITKKLHALDKRAKGGRIGLRSGTALASYPPFRGVSGQTLKTHRGAEMLETLPKSWLPKVYDTGALAASGTLAFRDRKPKEEVKETIITKKKKDLTEPPEGPKGPDIVDVVETAMTAKEIIDLKEKFKNKGWRDTTIITGSPAQGTRKSIPQRTNLTFLKELNEYSKQFHDGNLKSAIRALGGFEKVIGQKDKITESFYTTIQNAANRSGFKFETSSDKLESNIPQSKVPLTLVKLTDQLRTNPGVIDNRIRELKIDLDKVYNRKELADMIGLKRATDSLDKKQIRKDNFFFELLLDQDLQYKELPGGKVGFTGREVIDALKDYAKNKLRNYESRSYSSNLRKKSTENMNLRKKIDGAGAVNLQSQINKSFTRTLNKDDLYLPDSVAEYGHNPVPVSFTEKIEMLNDPALANKIFNIQNQTWQGKEINYNTLMRSSGTLEKSLKKLNQYYNAEVTKKNIGAIETIIDEIRDYYDSAVEKGGKAVENLPFHKNVIGKLDITVPQIGETLTADNFEVDMSGVDKRFIIGNVDVINSEAVKYKDLSKKEKEMYGQNIIDQKVQQIKEWYGPNGANYPPEIIEDLIEKLELGTAEVMGMLEREGLGKIKEEKIADTETKRINKILRKFDIIPWQALDEQITIAKKYGNLIDDDLMIKMLYDDDPQRLAEVMATIDEQLIMQNVKGMGPEEIIEATKESWKRKKQATGGLTGVDQYIINRGI